MLTSKSIFLTNFVPFLSRYVVLCILWCACCCLSHHRHELGTTCHLSILLLNMRLQVLQIKKFNFFLWHFKYYDDIIDSKKLGFVVPNQSFVWQNLGEYKKCQYCHHSDILWDTSSNRSNRISNYIRSRFLCLSTTTETE